MFYQKEISAADKPFQEYRFQIQLLLPADCFPQELQVPEYSS